MENDSNRQQVRGHTYSNIISRDQAQVHIGDKHSYGTFSTHNHSYYLCASSSDRSSQFLTLCGHSGIASNDGELLSLHRRRSPDENENKLRLDKEESLEHALSKLGELSKSIQDQKLGEDARKIVRRIVLAIDAVKKQQAGLPGHSNAESFAHMNHDGNDFENIRKNLKIARRVDVNTGFGRTKASKLTQVIRKCDKIAFEQWEISLKTLTFESRSSDGSEVIDSFISLYLEPRISGSGLPVTVRFGETRTHTGVSFVNPVILAYRVVPDFSEGFEMIINDDLEGLKMVLAHGMATLRDCTERGLTLLHQACRYGSVNCCQYLVDRGADIERISGATIFDNGKTPLSFCTNDDEFRSGRRPAHCGMVLLKSGADPTVANGNMPPPVMEAIESYPALLVSILAEGIDFIDLKNFRHYGKSLWLNACGNVSKTTPWTLQRLKDAGCNVAETDGLGWNCLFTCVILSKEPKSSNEFDTLRYLLSIFDDIHAKDGLGRTIFDHVDNMERDFSGSYQRDLWYCALDRAGIDVSAHLAQHPRVPSYRMNEDVEYTPLHYHALKHLQSWKVSNFRPQMDRLLQEIPLDEDEALEMDRWRQVESEVDRYQKYLEIQRQHWRQWWGLTADERKSQRRTARQGEN